LPEIDKILQDALESAGKVERPFSQSSDCAAIAAIYLDHGQNTRCLEVLLPALETADRIKQPDEKAICLARIAGLFFLAGDITRAQETFTRAVLLAQAAVTPAQQVKALYAVGGEYAGVNLGEEAAGVLARLYELVKTPENGLDIAYELIDIAGLYSDIHGVDTARTILDEAITASLALKDNWFKVERLLGIAETYAAMDSLPEAIDTITRLGPFLMNIEQLDRAGFYLRIADVYELAGDTPRVLDILLAALKSVEINEEACYQAENMVEIAQKYVSLEQKQKAIELLTRSCKKSEEIEDFRDRISILIKNAGLLGQAGERAQALETAKQALVLCQTYRDKKAVLYLLGNLGVVYAGLGEKAKAEEIVSAISGTVAETQAKTTGLGAIAIELSGAGDVNSAIKLVNLITDPHTRAESLAGIAGNLIERERESMSGS
jgi:tetratricopeptide (TPR) repeat protein